MITMMFSQRRFSQLQLNPAERQQEVPQSRDLQEKRNVKRQNARIQMERTYHVIFQFWASSRLSSSKMEIAPPVTEIGVSASQVPSLFMIIWFRSPFEWGVILKSQPLKAEGPTRIAKTYIQRCIKDTLSHKDRGVYDDYVCRGRVQQQRRRCFRLLRFWLWRLLRLWVAFSHVFVINFLLEDLASAASVS